MGGLEIIIIFPFLWGGIRSRHYGNKNCIDYEKLCPWKPYYLITRAQKPLQYNFVTITTWIVHLLYNYNL